jgi:hypothetical protein
MNVAGVEDAHRLDKRRRWRPYQHLVVTAALRPQCGEFPNEADSGGAQIPVCESLREPSREPSPLDEGEAQLAEPLNI